MMILALLIAGFSLLGIIVFFFLPDGTKTVAARVSSENHAEVAEQSPKSGSATNSIREGKRFINTVVQLFNFGKKNKVAPNGKLRRDLQSSIKDMEERQKTLAMRGKAPPLSIRLVQAGLEISIIQYYIYSLIVGGTIGSLCLSMGMGVGITMFFSGISALFLPRFWINRLRDKRQMKFLLEMPSAIDVMIRSLKSGLPLSSAIHTITTQTSEPVRSEFQTIADEVKFGIPLSEAIMKLHERIPLPETNFLGIVISVQAQSGGNLTEALSNLSAIIRERHAMRQKIKAMSSEARASAMIIGSLPLIVMTLVYMTSPEYILLLFETLKGNIILAVSGVWMAIGTFVMKKMIAMDF